MKKVLFAFVISLSLSGAVFALSDEDYLQMKKDSPEYARAEQNLTRVWKELKSSVSKSAYDILLKEQRT